MGYGVSRVYGLSPANQLGISQNLWLITGYGLWRVWVTRVSTVLVSMCQVASVVRTLTNYNCVLSKRGKTDSILVKRERGVYVLHEAVVRCQRGLSRHSLIHEQETSRVPVTQQRPRASPAELCPAKTPIFVLKYANF